ncbi:uncharacterized protein LOC122274346 [Carya illinoinensis]|uniref:uncharacterized protein LOC122274346 n=1 Tax=Carya illinoinensis TaxID=32201 RepID=UPI001C71DD2E|nr:uncharacterized protein LOC122274346 [Carya illinoinensis]
MSSQMYPDFSNSSPIPVRTSALEPNSTPTLMRSTHCSAPKPTQGKKLVSVVWSYFAKLEGGGFNNPQAKCNHYEKIYGCHNRKYGTFQMKVHLEEQYKKSLILRSLLEKSQFRLDIELKKMSDESGGGPTLKGYTKYNPNEYRRKITRIVIIDELPFQSVEGRGFQELV